MYGRRILLFSYGSGLASSMYSVVCRKVHECRFTLAHLQRSIQRARYRLDHERFEVSPLSMDSLLRERELNDHKGELFHMKNEIFERVLPFNCISFFSSFFSKTTN